MARRQARPSSNNGANLGFEQKLWQAADKLRNNMDAAEYKHVVLGLIFLKYISDAFEERHSQLEQLTQDPESDLFVREPEARYGIVEDPDEYRAESVFWVPQEARWAHLLANAKQPTIGRFVDDAMVAIERDNPALKGVLPKTYARPDLDKQRLGELIDLISTISLGDRENRSKDILGRVYEYFLGQFASAEGKKGGQFYTARCVVQLLVEMLAPYKGRVYDPCCGSGGMFVQSEKFVEEHGGRIGAISIYGQESNPTTWRLAKMNLAIRGIESNLGAEPADSFHNDLHKDLKADYILANPPFNTSDWGGERLRDDIRWKYGRPPVSNANFAWVQHFIHHLAPRGTAGFVLAQVSLSSESPVESEIRKQIIEDDLVDCIVTLPGRLFYSTPIPVCLWFVARDKKGGGRLRDRREQVLFIDASLLGTPESRTRSYLKDTDISTIASAYHRWREKEGDYEDTPGFCKAVTIVGIREVGYSLFPATYIGTRLQRANSGHGSLVKQIATRVSCHRKLQKDVVAATDAVDRRLSAISTGAQVRLPRSYVRLCLADILERSDERLGSRPEPEILTCTERAGIILQKERFAKRVAIEDTSKYKVVRKTDIVYNPYLLWAGAIDQLWIAELGITSPAYEVLRIREGFDPTLIGALLKSSGLMQMYNGISVGTVQRRRRAPVERFLQLAVSVPSKDDQAFFTEVASAFQEEVWSLREMSAEAREIIYNLCRLWLKTS